MIDDIRFSMIIDNKEKNFIIIDIFKKNNKNYAIYKEENSDEIYVMLCEVKENDIKLIPIESDVDYDVVDEYLSSL